MTRLSRRQLGQLARDLRRAAAFRDEQAAYEIVTTLTPAAHTTPGARTLLGKAEQTFLALHAKKAARRAARAARVSAPDERDAHAQARDAEYAEYVAAQVAQEQP